MSACPSLPISVAAARAGRGVAGTDRVPADLLTALGSVDDPRARRGVRHGFFAVLAIGVGAVLGGARSYVAIAEWGHDLPVGVRVGLGLARFAPSESTIRRTLQAVDAEALDRVVSALLVTRCSPPSAPPAVGSGRGAAGVRGRREERPRGAGP